MPSDPIVGRQRGEASGAGGGSDGPSINTTESASRAAEGPKSRAAVTFPIPPAAPVTSCRSCGAEIVWIVTSAGRRMPVETGEDGPRGESHFAYCPHASTWRKPR